MENIGTIKVIEKNIKRQSSVLPKCFFLLLSEKDETMLKDEESWLPDRNDFSRIIVLRNKFDVDYKELDNICED